MRKILHWKRRPFVYAFVLSVGFALLLSTLRDAAIKNYFIGSAVLYLVLVFELYSTKFYAQDVLSQFKLPPVESKDKNVQLIHHLLLPSFIYIGLVGFVFFNSLRSIDLLIVTVSFLIFTVLFTNVRAYYEDKFQLEHSTHSIYDIINIISLFVFTDSILNLFNYFGMNLYFAAGIIVAMFLLFSVLVLMRYFLLNMHQIGVLLGTVIAVGVSMVLFIMFGFAFLLISFLVSLLFYYQLAYYNHLRDDTFSKEILFEYVVVFFILIVLIFGVS